MSVTTIRIHYVGNDAQFSREIGAESAWTVSAAETLAETWRQLEEGTHFDVLLLDLSPDDGQCLEAVRKLAESPLVDVVILLTSAEDEHFELAAIENGAQDCLRKGDQQRQRLQRSIQTAVARRAKRGGLEGESQGDWLDWNAPGEEIPERGSSKSSWLDIAPPSGFSPGLHAQPEPPKPLPKRPNGRLFVGAILIAIVAYATHEAWNAFLRYEAYGVVVGRRIEVYPPWDGALAYTYVNEGERVQQGCLLMKFANHELEQSIADLVDQQKVAQAEIQAKIAELKHQAVVYRVPRQEASAEYFELWAQLVSEQAKLAELNSSRLRVQDLHKQGAATSSDFDKTTFARQGQIQKVEKLQAALVEAKKRVDFSNDLLVPEEDRIQPLLARLDWLGQQERRLREKLALGDVRAPVNGVVLERQRQVGEFCHFAQPALVLLEDSSLEIAVFLRQRSVEKFRLGSQARVVVEPDASPLSCQVVRVGDQYTDAPPAISTRFRSNENLLPIFLQPLDSQKNRFRARLGAIVKVLPQ